ncbi:MAG: lysophospholipid acyltransferase family protein [Bacteroidales bacterium]|nr:lysophospholipid acyltransferase family protein [Bacteroidales bacterium]
MKYRLIKALVMPLAWMPFGVLYALSDLIYLLIYRIAGYRKGVVRDNLARCFPDKTDRERLDIERQFFRNFADNIVETIKLLHISDDEMRRRMKFDNDGLIDKRLSSGRSIVIYFAHTFNWEWAPSVTLHTAVKPDDKHVFAQVYRPLRDAAFDRLMLDIRSRFGSRSFPKSSTLRDLLRLRRDGAASVTGFMSDQHPSHGDPGYLTTLLGRPTLMISGTETLARKLDMTVMYWDISRPSRGHYHITTRLITDHPADEPDGSITETYTRLLEKTIRRDPSLWLWSHKRWKHPVTPQQK